MTSTAIRDLLDALVALGTLSLAGFTFYLGTATKKLGTEARNARLDALAPRVVITSFQVLREPVTRPTAVGQPPVKADPGTSWDMTKYGEIQLGVHAVGVATNEGEGTAFITLVPGEGTEFYGFEEEIEPTQLPTKFRVPLQGNVVSIGAHQSVRFNLILWKSTKEWCNAWNQFQFAPPAADGNSTIEVSNRFAAVRDTFKVGFNKLPLVPKQLEDGWMIANADDVHSISNPGTATVAIAVVSPVERRYD